MYRQEFPDQPRYPDYRVILRAVERFLLRGDHVPHRGGGGREQRVDEEQRDQIMQILEVRPGTSTRREDARSGVSQMTVHRIWRSAGYYPFHKTPVQNLHPADAAARLQFCNWILQQHQADPNFTDFILFSDESMFSREPTSNCHNDHHWAQENRHAKRVRGFQQRFSVNLWCGIIGNQRVSPS